MIESGGTITSLGHNLFSDRPTLTLDPTDLTNIDPLLATLRDNGGPTPTEALLPGGPAIDAGVVVPGVTTDQRGVIRPQGSAPDIGAFESRGFSLVVASGQGQQTTVGEPFSIPLTVQVTSPFGEPVQGGLVNFAAPATGPSALLSGNATSVNAAGQATIVATANGEAGNFTVSAETAGAGNAFFNLSNLPLPPTVIAFQRFGVHRQPTTLRLGFSQSMNAFRAQQLANYRLVWAGPDGRIGTRDDRPVRILLAHYDAPTRSVRLTPASALPLHSVFQLTVNGMPPNGLTNQLGTFLAGAGGDESGTNFVATLGPRQIVPVSRRGGGK